MVFSTIGGAGGGSAETPTGGGWTDDGSTVRLTTEGDDVGVGTAIADEKLTVDGVVSLKAQSSAASSATNHAKIYSDMTDLDEDIVLLLHGQGADSGTTITDSSDGGHTPSANTDVITDTAQSTLSQSSSLNFNGTTSYLTYADSADWDIAADSAFVIHMWVRFDGDPVPSVFVSGTSAAGYRLLYHTNSGGTFQFAYGPALFGNIVFADTGVPSNTWFHLAVVRQVDGTFRLFRDGVQKGSDGSFTDAIEPPGLRVGRDHTTAQFFFDGWIQELTIISGSDNGWTGTSFTPPTVTLGTGRIRLPETKIVGTGTREVVGATDPALLVSGGNVGIGIDAPRTALDVHHDPTGLSDNTGGGEVVFFGNDTSTTAGRLYYLYTNGNWTETSADNPAYGADQLLGIALGSSVSADGILVNGFFDATTKLSNFSTGKAVFVSADDEGKMDTTAPSGSGDFVRVVGYCTDVANVIYFNPSREWVVL